MLLRPDGVKTRQATGAISGSEIRLLQDYEALARKLGWEPYLICRDCQLEFGAPKDGVRIVSGDTTFAIECAHQRYVFQGGTRSSGVTP